MQASPMTVGMVGFDTFAQLTKPQYEAMKARSYHFAVRYYSNLRQNELQDCLESGLGLLLVSTGMSFSDPVSRLRSLGYPEGCHVYADLEGAKADPTADLNLWSRKVIDGGYRAGLYYGAGCFLSGAELYKLPWFTSYWESCSHEKDRKGLDVMPTMGRNLIQLYPPNIELRDEWGKVWFPIDVDVVQQDEKGRTPYMATR